MRAIYMPADAHSGIVKAFYERNTRRFLRWGGGSREGVIHREVWGPGVETREQAFQYVHEVLLRRLPALDRPVRVLDLGCGVGSSLFYLCRHAGQNIEAVGVTISPTQVALAKEKAEEWGLAQQTTFLEADFTDLPALAPFDFVYSIEAFVHASSAQAYLSQVSDVLLPTGRLCLIDDFLESSVDNNQLDRFRDGWRVQSLVSAQELKEIASGFELSLSNDTNLTPYLNLGRPRDQFIKGMLAIPGVRKLRSEYIKGLNGGDALQACLKGGLITYRVVEFEKRS